LFPPLTRAVLDGTAEAGAKLVFADNLYVYGPPEGPMTEETPQRAQGKKGRIRIDMASAILRAHADGRLRCTIGRSADYYGPRGTTTTVGDNLMKPVLRGKRARWLGSLDQPHTLNHLEDMARALVPLGERNEADGQGWHLPAAAPLTGRQFLTLVNAARVAATRPSGRLIEAMFTWTSPRRMSADCYPELHGWRSGAAGARSGPERVRLPSAEPPLPSRASQADGDAGGRRTRVGPIAGSDIESPRAWRVRPRNGAPVMSTTGLATPGVESTGIRRRGPVLCKACTG
jgi:hypothetical protein